jgi:Gpi18-like mannosyltransferase
LFVSFLLAFICRLYFIDYQSNDYNVFLKNWFDTLKNNGGLAGIGVSIGDYTPPYIYILALLTYLPIKSLYTIKLVSIIFDLFLAIYVMKLVAIKNNSLLIQAAAFSSVLFAPTIILNSAMWAQCDSMYALGLVACLYYILKERPFVASFAFAFAFIFKLQAVFLLPFLFFLTLKGKFKIRYYFTTAFFYLISIIPAFIAGRPINELLTVYFRQTQTYKQFINLNAPTFYAWIPHKLSEIFGPAGVVFALCVVLFILFALYFKPFILNDNFIILVALLFTLLVPFLLPYMHERYFYVADVFAIIYAFSNQKRFFIPVITIIISFITYSNYLFDNEIIPLMLLPFGLLFVILVLLVDIYKSYPKSMKN